MAPEPRHATSGDADSYAPVSRRSGQNEAGGMPLWRKVALSAGLVVSDGVSVFNNLNEMPLQQALGTPVYLLTLAGALSALLALVLVPLMGWFADGGSRPQHRKRPMTLVAFVVVVLGLCLNLSATLLSPREDAKLNDNRTYAGSFSFKDSDNFTYENSTWTLNPDDNDDVWGLPVPAKLSMAGFVFMDLGFDLTNCAVKALILTHSDPADHITLLVTGVVMAAVGGCSTSVSGVVDFGNVLPELSSACSQAAVQLSILTAMCVLCCTTSLLTASTASSTSSVHSADDSPAVEKGHRKTGVEKEDAWREEATMPSDRLSRDMKENTFLASTPGEVIMSMSTQLESSFRGLSISNAFSRSQVVHHVKNDETSSLLQENKECDVIPEDVVATSDDFRNNRKFKVSVLWLVAYFTSCSIFAYNVSLADYVGKVIYGGNPHAKTNSEEYQLYQQGVHSAALSIVILNATYVVGALCQNKVMTLINPKVEYVGVKVVLIIVLVTMHQTARLWSVFVTAAVMGISRAVLFTVPFILATRLCCHEQPQTEKELDKQSSRFGSTMALMTSAIPSAYLVVNALIGPLVDATGDPSAPILMTIVTSILAAITVCFYKF